jgi:drug/metabolite transporter (DMT)-like permease
MMYLKNSKGAIFVIISALFFGSYGIWSKLMGSEFDDFTQAWMRGLIVVLILLPIGYFTKSLKKIAKKDIKWFLIYTVPGSLVFPFYFLGFRYLDIGTATLLFYSSLTITSYILGILFFKEKMNIWKIASLIIGIIGLLLIFKVSFDLGKVVPAIITILAGACGGTEVVFSKKVSDKYSPLQLTAVLYFVDIVVNLTLNLLVSRIRFTSDMTAWTGLLMYSISGLLSFTFVSLGYKHLEPSIASIIGLLEVPIGIFFGILLFSENLSISILIGTILIIAAAALPNIKSLLNRKK